MSDDAAAAASPSPSASPFPSSASSSGASPSPTSPRTKRRRTDRYALGFEFAPRLAPYELPEDPLAEDSLPDKPKRAGPEWTERSTFALLDAWGDSFICAGRSIIRADEWLEVARRVCAAADRPEGYFSDSQCRNRVDTLRKKFKKERERARLATRRSGHFSKWVYYDKMVSILCPSPQPPPPAAPAPAPASAPLPLQLLPLAAKRRRDRQPSRRFQWGTKAPERLLGGGGDVVVPRVSGSGAELGEREREPKKNIAVEGDRNGFVALTESIQKFEEVFVRMESSKRRQMAEVEQMRRDLQRDLDAKWREILEKAQAEIACLSSEDEDEGDADEGGNAGDGKKLEDGGDEQNNGAMDASP